MRKERTVTAEDDGETVVGAEQRLRQLQEERERQDLQRTDASATVDNPPTEQVGVVRDIDRTDTRRVVLDVETEYGNHDVSMSLPSGEYSLDNDLVRLLEWKGIDEGRIGELLGETVYVDTSGYRGGDLVLPSSLSPTARVGTHARVRGRPYIEQAAGYFDLNDAAHPRQTYSLIVSISALFGMFLAMFLSISLMSSVITAVLGFVFFWVVLSFIGGPMLFASGVGAYRRLKQAWKRRYHEL